MEEVRVPATYVMEIKSDEEKEIWREFMVNTEGREKKRILMEFVREFNRGKRDEKTGENS